MCVVKGLKRSQWDGMSEAAGMDAAKVERSVMRLCRGVFNRAKGAKGARGEGVDEAAVVCTVLKRHTGMWNIVRATGMWLSNKRDQFGPTEDCGMLLILLPEQPVQPLRGTRRFCEVFFFSASFSLHYDKITRRA